MPKTEKICPVCGISSKALHLHMRSHKAEQKPNVEAVEPVTDEQIKKGIEIQEAIDLADEKMLGSEDDPTIDNPPVVDKTDIDGQDIPLTDEMLNTPQLGEPVTNVNNCEYFLEMSFNGEVYKAYTNNLDISIQSFAKPVLTEMFVEIAKNNQGDPFVKKLTLVQGKQLFNDPQNREIFLNLYYSLYGRPQTEQRLNNL